MNKRLLALLALLGLPRAARSGAGAAAPAAPQPQQDVQQTHLPGDSVQAASPVAGVPTRISFDEAVKRAVAQNPSVLVAAANILSAQGLLRQARAAVLPNVAVTGTNVTLDDSRGIGDQVFTPQNTFSAGIGVAMPLFAPAQWAQRVQALDAQHVAEASTDEVKRQIARRDGAGALSRDRRAARRGIAGSRAGYAYAFYEIRRQSPQGGRRHSPTALQAQLTVSADEALGRNRAASRSTDRRKRWASRSPKMCRWTRRTSLCSRFRKKPRHSARSIRQSSERTDIKLANLQVFAAQRIVSDSWKDWLPSVTGLFQPLFQDPGTDVSPRTSWRAVLSFGVPVFDAGSRRGAKEIRQASLQQSPGSAERTGPRGEIRGAPRLRVGAPQRARAPELACRVAAGLAGRSTSPRFSFRARRGDEPRRHRRRSAARATRIRRSRLRKTPCASRGWTCSLRLDRFP